jgi:hypothetical protein
VSEPGDIQPTWATRELPILRAALRRIDQGGKQDLEPLRVETGIDGLQLRIGLQALQNATPPYLEMNLGSGWRSDYASGLLLSVSERTRRELGSWPSPASVVDQLVEALRAAAEAEPEPAQKSRLQTTADALTGLAYEVAVQAIAARLGTL